MWLKKTKIIPLKIIKYKDGTESEWEKVANNNYVLLN